MVLGSLYDQVIYPHDGQSIAHEQDEKGVKLALKLANLEYLLSRFELHEVEIWSSVLSGGEQQRISLARVFYHKPKFAILDESTSALDPQNEELMYMTCAKLCITIISIGHRESLINYHQKMLQLDGKGGWALFEKEEI
uniref:ABC transporter domain-containing protein n=1 Tax=Arcella intermedia TaxID=1963864 RepID=A0A6B2LMR8_9EUKA